MKTSKADLEKTFGKSFGCSRTLKRIAPFFLVNLIFLATVIAALNGIVSALGTTPLRPFTLSVLFSFLPVVIGAGVVIIILFFVYLYFQSGIISNAGSFWSGREVKFTQSLRDARPKYPSLVGAAIITGIIVLFLSLVPLVGWLLSIIVSWFFVVYAPSVIVGRKGVVSSIQESYDIFMSRKLDTFLFWLLLAVLSAVFTLLAFIPLFIVAVPTILSIPALGLIGAFQANSLIIAIGGIITAFFLAFVTVFTESARTFYYIQVKKTR
jgi:hypothetical protein